MPTSNTYEQKFRTFKSQIDAYLESILDCKHNPHHRLQLLRDMLDRSRRGKFHRNAIMKTVVHNRSFKDRDFIFDSACRELLAKYQRAQVGGDAA